MVERTATASYTENLKGARHHTNLIRLPTREQRCARNMLPLGHSCELCDASPESTDCHVERDALELWSIACYLANYDDAKEDEYIRH